MASDTTRGAPRALRVALVLVLLTTRLATGADPSGATVHGSLSRETRRAFGFEPTSATVDEFIVRGSSYHGRIRAASLRITPLGSTRAPPLELTFPGANECAALIGDDERPVRTHYYLGPDPQRWRRDVPSFGRVRVRDLYPGVDLVYYGQGGDLEFDFIVSPGVDPSVIRIEVDSEHSLEVDADGDLVVDLPGSAFRLHRPWVHQETDSSAGRRDVDARYDVASSGRRAEIALGAYDSSRALTIDPLLVSSTRVGTSEIDNAKSVATDRDGNIYLTGWTSTTGLATPEGEEALRLGESGQQDCWLMKLAPDGSTVLLTVYFGGTRDDRAKSVEVDDDGYIYIAGDTSFAESGFPITEDAYRTSAADFFILKLDASGGLVYSTYFGGLNRGSFGDIAVHGSGDSARVYVTGSSLRGHPTTSTAYRRGVVGTSDVFLTVLEPHRAEGSQLVYSSMIGADSSDSGLAVDTNAEGHAYVLGSTTGAGLPLRHAFDSVQGGRENFLVVFDPAASGDDSLLYSSYIGGSNSENTNAGAGDLAVDEDGIALVVGLTSSSDFPVTPEGFRLGLQISDAFLVAIDPTRPGADSLLYGTLIGTRGGDLATAVAAGPSGHAYVVGYTQSDDLTSSDGEPVEKFGAGAPGRGQDTFVVAVDWKRSGIDSLVDAVYIGGTEADFPRGVAVGPGGEIHIVGETASDDMFDPLPAFGRQDGFLATIRLTRQLPVGIVGAASLDVLEAGFGASPHTWALVDGAVPEGLELSEDGSLGGEPTQEGVSTFTVEITDALGETVRQSYRKRIGTGATRGDILIRKAGVRAIPGRVLPYYILLRNRSDRTIYDIEVVELLERWFIFESATPPPTVLEPRPGHVYWTIPKLDPGELFVITYRVRLPNDFPLGVIVSGDACVNEEDCHEFRADCEEEGAEFCENTLCEGPASGPRCIACTQDEKNRCRDQWMKCMDLIGKGSSESLPEGESGGGCYAFFSPTAAPFDPNEKTVANRPYIVSGEVLGYTIHFENIGDAEARDIFLTDVLDEDLDLSTIQAARRLGGLVPVPPDGTVSIYDDDGEEWTVSLDTETRTLRWELLDVNLPPEATNSVFFVVQAPEGLPSGAEIRNEATIQFEVFEPITTNETLNVIDETPPTSTMSPLPKTTPTEEFEISWSGVDDVSEIDLIAVYVSENDGPYLQHFASASETSTTFTGEFGSTYSFLTVARDIAGNVELLDGVAEAVTTLVPDARPAFHRGDPNASGVADISDGIAIFNYLFLGGPSVLDCRESADVNNDGATDISDGIYLLAWLFTGGEPPPAPGPTDAPCGPDPDPPGSAGDLGCDAYPPCG